MKINFFIILIISRDSELSEGRLIYVKLCLSSQHSLSNACDSISDWDLE